MRVLSGVVTRYGAVSRLSTVRFRHTPCYAPRNRMSLFTIFLSTGMFAYWFARGWLVVLGPNDQIVRRLQEDEWNMHRLRILLRTLFFPGMELGLF